MKIIIGDVGNRGIRIPKFIAKHCKILSDHILVDKISRKCYFKF